MFAFVIMCSWLLNAFTFVRLSAVTTNESNKKYDMKYWAFLFVPFNRLKIFSLKFLRWVTLNTHTKTKQVFFCRSSYFILKFDFWHLDVTCSFGSYFLFSSNIRQCYTLWASNQIKFWCSIELRVLLLSFLFSVVEIGYLNETRNSVITLLLHCEILAYFVYYIFTKKQIDLSTSALN